jgi:Fur family ferric uptake transcriptional regulator
MRAVDILSVHNLKRTSCREGILDDLMSANEALSENDIRERLAGNYDRTTFYRSFKTLEKHKIIHKIIVDSQLIKYALDRSVTNKEGHAHFYCNECHTVRCMDTSHVQKCRLPEGYSHVETQVIIKGTCANCESQIKN